MILLLFAIKNKFNIEYLTMGFYNSFLIQNEVALKTIWPKLSSSRKEEDLHSMLLSLFDSSCFYDFLYNKTFILNKSTMEILRFLICNANEAALRNTLIHENFLDMHLFVL